MKEVDRGREEERGSREEPEQERRSGVDEGVAVRCRCGHKHVAWTPENWYRHRALHGQISADRAPRRW